MATNAGGCDCAELNFTGTRISLKIGSSPEPPETQKCSPASTLILASWRTPLDPAWTLTYRTGETMSAILNHQVCGNYDAEINAEDNSYHLNLVWHKRDYSSVNQKNSNSRGTMTLVWS